MDKIFDIRLEKLTYGGDAMGRLPDARAIFVPFGLPGELVRVEIVEEKKNFARGKILEVMQAAPNRIAPKCKHFGACGGCRYQHLSYADQLKAKEEILRDQLQRIGKIQNPPVLPVVASPLEWNYRNHVQFHLTRAGRLGFVPVEGAEILAIEECYLPEESIGALWRGLQFESDEDAQRVSLRAGADDALIILESQSPDLPELEIEADASVVHLCEGHAVTLAGSDWLTMNVLGKEFKVSAASFFQVNIKMAEKMAEHLLAELSVSPSDTLLDLYCGVGLFSKFFAPCVGRLIGVESSSSACEDFAANLDEFEHVELYEGATEQVLPALAAQVKADCAIIDPPRAGLERYALDALIAMQPRFIAYVSCDPSTLARDAARLQANGYVLKQVTPFDLFPQTYHIESISIFQR
ncbi:MAG: 23S rRNA (uracil(1939)-C(5))-methyltransferase RlmD [Anaerolineales bacterium]